MSPWGVEWITDEFRTFLIPFLVSMGKLSANFTIHKWEEKQFSLLFWKIYSLRWKSINFFSTSNDSQQMKQKRKTICRIEKSFLGFHNPLLFSGTWSGKPRKNPSMGSENLLNIEMRSEIIFRFNGNLLFLKFIRRQTLKSFGSMSNVNNWLMR